MNIDILLRQTPALPSLPHVAHELIQTLSNEDVPIEEIASKLAVDQVLSAKVLRLANSAYYSEPRTISTLDDAVRQLGFRTVRTLVVSAAMAGGHRPMPGIDMLRFWRYALHTAAGAKYMAKLCGCDIELAFMVGLLHGIGRLVMAAGMADDMSTIAVGISSFPCRERIDAERAAFGFTYADVGAALVRRWNFPDSIADAIVGVAEPHAFEPPQILHGVVHLATWRARSDEDEIGDVELAASFPEAVGRIAGLSLEQVLYQMPPLSKLSVGLEALLPRSTEDRRKTARPGETPRRAT